MDRSLESFRRKEKVPLVTASVLSPTKQRCHAKFRGFKQAKSKLHFYFFYIISYFVNNTIELLNQYE